MDYSKVIRNNDEARFVFGIYGGVGESSFLSLAWHRMSWRRPILFAGRFSHQNLLYHRHRTFHLLGLYIEFNYRPVYKGRREAKKVPQQGARTKAT